MSSRSVGPSAIVMNMPQNIVGRERRHPQRSSSMPARLALGGDRSPSVRAHGRIPLLIDALRRREGVVRDPYWIPSTEAGDLQDFDGSCVVPGSRYSDPETVCGRVRPAREREIPFLGTCGGFQHAILELAESLAEAV